MAKKSTETRSARRTRAHVPITAYLFWIWVGLTLLISLSILVLVQWKGPHGLDIVLYKGPLSRLQITMSAVVMVWLEAGLFLFLLSSGRIRKDNAFTWAGFFLITLLYINLLRERTDYGDAYSYIRGAQALIDDQPFGRTYIYPPFWAILLKPIAPMGEKGAIDVLWNLNIPALGLFYFLSIRVLDRYGFSERLAAALVTLFMLVNVPLLRTMLYLQVNLHVLNLIFVSLLLQRRSPFWSALAMALAVHFKVSPAVLALAFLLEKDWRWLGWVSFHTLAIFGLTILSDGFQPYLDYLYNLSLLNIPHGLNFRETSFDSFFGGFVQLIGRDYSLARPPIYLAKGLLAVTVFLTIARTIRQRLFHEGEASRLMNSFPPLMILMNMTSPLVWEHHGVFLVLVFLLLFKRIDTPLDWSWFGAAYFLEFLLPTFDFFPFSYGRLLAPLIVLWLIWRLPGGKRTSSFFKRTSHLLEEIRV